MFRFGYCSVPTYGAVTADVGDIRLQRDIKVTQTRYGGTYRSASGTATRDELGRKWRWAATVKPFRDITEWWPIHRRVEQWQGLWMFYDVTRPSRMTDAQGLMQTWTNSTGADLSERADGGINVGVGSNCQMGTSTGPARTLLVPVVAGQSYFYGMSVYGSGAWTVTPTIAWYDAAGSAALSTTVGSAQTATTALSSHKYLDGSIRASRIGVAGVAPAGAVYAQCRALVGGSACDLSDPVLMDGTTDPGHAWFVVDVDDWDMTHHFETRASSNLTLTEA